MYTLRLNGNAGTQKLAEWQGEFEQIKPIIEGFGSTREAWKVVRGQAGSGIESIGMAYLKDSGSHLTLIKRATTDDLPL